MDNTCVQCGTSFVVEAKDLTFYEKVSPILNGDRYAVPPPTHCPPCRQQRRLAWRNERTLYERACNLCEKRIISIYDAHAPFPVYCTSCWWSDRWDPMTYGQSFNDSQPFFVQYAALQQRVPRLAIFLKNAENSEYSNHSDGIKNCYLGVDIGFSEDVHYSKWIIRSRNIVDCYQMSASELCYESLYGDFNYHCIKTVLTENCSDSAFLYDCRSCRNCFMCWNLKHKEYCINNEQLTKDAYMERMREIQLGSRQTFQALEAQFHEIVRTRAIHRHQVLTGCEDCSGNFLYKCKNVTDSYEILESQDCRYCYDAGWMKDCYDAYEPAFNCELQYDAHACNRGTRVLFSHVSYDVDSVIFADSCHNSSNLFGCIGLKRKQWCILNKEYSKEEYERLAGTLIEHMRSSGEWGSFFPVALSPFAYNETAAQDYFPLSQTEAQSKGWKWKEHRQKQNAPHGIKIPDSIQNVPDSIVSEIISCSACGKNYRIIEQELTFYRRLGVPVPDQCPACRHLHRMNLRNPRMLVSRTCAKCHTVIQTSYAPERPETVYCESCYLNTVY